jgi:hypothetical protein
VSNNPTRYCSILVIIGDTRELGIADSLPFIQENGAKLYQGGLDSGGLVRSGYGVAYSKEGNISYKGLWENDLRHGLGTSYFISGRIEAEGQWQNDSLSGLASRHYNSTFYYAGQFEAGQRSGQGLEFQNSQLIYEGQFVGDKRSGHGTEYIAVGNKGQIIYVGQWMKGLRHGHGTEYWPDNPHFYYRGQWVTGLKHGYGRNVYGTEANYYEGHFVNGLRQGQGTLVLPKYQYHGGWDQDSMNGLGQLNYTDGSHYTGHFKDNLLHGKVRIKALNNSIPFLPASTRSVPPGIHFALLLLLLLWRPLVKLGTISDDS